MDLFGDFKRFLVNWLIKFSLVYYYNLWNLLFWINMIYSSACRKKKSLFSLQYILSHYKLIEKGDYFWNASFSAVGCADLTFSPFIEMLYNGRSMLQKDAV
jgi:hypothetical protein